MRYRLSSTKLYPGLAPGSQPYKGSKSLSIIVEHFNSLVPHHCTGRTCDYVLVRIMRIVFFWSQSENFPGRFHHDHTRLKLWSQITCPTSLPELAVDAINDLVSPHNPNETMARNVNHAWLLRLSMIAMISSLATTRALIRATWASLAASKRLTPSTKT